MLPTTTKNTHKIRAPGPAAMARQRDPATVSSSGSPASVWWERREEGARWTRAGRTWKRSRDWSARNPERRREEQQPAARGGGARSFGRQRGVAARVGLQRGVGQWR